MTGLCPWIHQSDGRGKEGSIEGSKWSTIYLQFVLQLNRRLRGRGAHFWSTI